MTCICILSLLIVYHDIAPAQIPQPIHFTVTVSDTQLSNSRRVSLFTHHSAGSKRVAKAQRIQDSDLELDDLAPGQTYYAIPDGAGSMVLTPNDGVAAVGAGGQVDIVGDTNTQSIVSFVLPDRLYPTGITGNGFVTVRFNNISAAWGDVGAEVNYFDPSIPTTVSLGASGSVSIMLGGIFEVDANSGPDAYEGEGSLTVSGDTIAHRIHFKVNVVGLIYPPLGIDSDLELDNFVRGRTYSAIPDGQRGLTLTPNDGIAEVGSSGQAIFAGRPYGHIQVSFVLPQVLSRTSGGGTGDVKVYFDSTSGTWGKPGVEMNYFDPRAILSVTLNSSGEATFVLGGIFQVDSGITPGTYEGEALITAQIVATVLQHPDAESPKSFQLSQNYPNPFNPTTTIRFQIPTWSIVQLRIFDVAGREVAILVKDVKAPGEYIVKWDASSSPSGVYYYKLEAGTHSEVKKLVLIR